MIIFTDIDDTLMRTERKIKEDVSSLMVGAYGKSGKPISFIDKKREKFIDEIINKNITIPVTARNKTSFKNLNIKFNSYAILNFGFNIMDKNGNDLSFWKNQMIKKSNDLNQEDIFKKIKELKNEIFEIKIENDSNCDIYINFRDKNFSNSFDELKNEIYSIIGESMIKENFYFYQTDRDLAMLPKFIKKEIATKYIMDTLIDKDSLTIGIGDHKNDLSFMSLCDFIIAPTDSTLVANIK